MNELGKRFWSKVDRSDGLDACWPWTAHRDHLGYGRFRLNGKVRPAHRIACEQALGPCPDGLETRHLCGNRACCNPLHLCWGTHAENMADIKRYGGGFPDRRGSSNAFHKLTEDDVRAIKDSSDRQADIARRYGVSPCAINDIAKGRTWAWMT